MPRHTATKPSRTAGVSRLPALASVRSTPTTPLSSAQPSAYTSEAEWDAEHDIVAKIPIGSLSLQGGSIEAITAKTPTKRKEKAKPFPFLQLPSELRVKIYAYYFAETGRVIDLDPDNYKRIHKKLGILRTCRIIYHEASYVFYSTHSFRVFPTHPGRFFKTKKPLLARLTSRQRSYITALELRLGPGWNKPPRGWVVNPALGLDECVNVRTMTVFVECDPSDGVFNGFRRADGFYETFSRNLLQDVLHEMPFLDVVHFDAWTSVKKSGAMMCALLETTLALGRKVCWGPERGWTDLHDDKVDTTATRTATATATALLNGVGMNVVIVA